MGKTYFISYTTKDEQQATWIVGVLEEHGQTTRIQAWDILAGDNFISKMNEFLKECDVCVLVLSQSYLDSAYCEEEWTNALACAVKEKNKRVVPVRVEEIKPDGLLYTRVYIDLHNIHDEKIAEQKLLVGFGLERNTRVKPIFQPSSKLLSTPPIFNQHIPSHDILRSGNFDVGKTLLDAWSLSTAFLQLLNNERQDSRETSALSMNNLFTALILWDDICIFPAHSLLLSAFNKLHETDSTRKLFELCTLIDDPKLEKYKIDMPAVDEMSIVRFDDQNHDTNLERVWIYQKICSSVGVNYFPRPERAEYLLEHGIYTKEFNRYKTLEILDTGLREYYDELSSEYDNELLYFEYPVLYDYIRCESDSTSPIDQLRVALELRKDKDVIAFRRGLDSLDIELNRGNRGAKINAIKQLTNLSKSITNDYASNTKETGKAKICKMKVAFSIPFLNKTNTDDYKKDERVLDLTFLTRLRDFGVGKSV